MTRRVQEEGFARRHQPRTCGCQQGTNAVSCTLLHNLRTASRLFFAWLRGLARLCTYVSSLLSVVSGALSFTV